MNHERLTDHRLWSLLVLATAVTFAAETAETVSRHDIEIPSESPVDLATCVQYAEENNPALEAAFNRWQGSLQRITEERGLPDPRLTYRYFIREVETRVGPQRQAVELSQRFPWFGKLDLAADVAAQAAQAQYHRFEAARRQLLLEVRTAYYELYYLERALAITQENIQLLQHLDDVVHIRYSTVTASHPDVIRVQVELGRLEDRLKSLQDVRASALARLNAALNRPPAAPLIVPETLSPSVPSLDPPTLQHDLDETHPDLLALLATVKESERATELARRGFLPDVTLGVSAVDVDRSLFSNPPDNGRDIVGVTVSVNIPLWVDRISAKVRRNKYQELTARQQHRDLRNRLQARLERALFELRDAQRKQNLYGQTLVPKAVESLRATEESFRNGTGVFLDLIDAQRVLLEFQLAFQRAIADTGVGLARVTALTGELSVDSGNATGR